MLGLEITNHTFEPLTNFDIMFDRNPFWLFISGQANKIKVPASQTVYKRLVCSLNKKNADKNSPQFPFYVQIAIKTSLDVFHFRVPCMLHCLIMPQQMTKDSFKTFWEKIPLHHQSDMQVPTLYSGYMQRGDLPDAVIEGLTANHFQSLVRVRGNQDTASVLYFGAYTIKNLPLLVEITVPDNRQNFGVLIKYPVSQLQPLLEESIIYILTRST